MQKNVRIRSHIVIERKVIKVEDGKGGYTSNVPINETARGQFLKLMEKKRGDYVFHDQYGRRIKDIKRSFGSALERAGLYDVRFHDLRRTFGTMCVFKNVPPKTLQKWMGHKSMETAMKYYVVSPEDFEQEAIKRLDIGMDTYTDTSKEKGSQEDLQPLEFTGEPCRIRTCDPLIKSLKSWVSPSFLKLIFFFISICYNLCSFLSFDLIVSFCYLYVT